MSVRMTFFAHDSEGRVLVCSTQHARDEVSELFDDVRGFASFGDDDLPAFDHGSVLWFWREADRDAFELDVGAGALRLQDAPRAVQKAAKALRLDGDAMELDEFAVDRLKPVVAPKKAERAVKKPSVSERLDLPTSTQLTMWFLLDAWGTLKIAEGPPEWVRDGSDARRAAWLDGMRAAWESLTDEERRIFGRVQVQGRATNAMIADLLKVPDSDVVSIVRSAKDKLRAAASGISVT